jgi:hypothetical protein
MMDDTSESSTSTPNQIHVLPSEVETFASAETMVIVALIKMRRRSRWIISVKFLEHFLLEGCSSVLRVT